MFQCFSRMFRGFLCWLISAWLEMAVEPIIIYAESFFLTEMSVLVESCAITLQSIVTIVLLYLYAEDTEVLVLIQSYGQLVYSIALALGYYGYAWFSGILNKVWPSSFKIKYETLNQAAVELGGFLR
jgi:hypothetical protein